MRILGLIFFDKIGGAEKFIFHLAEGIQAHGHSYDVLLIHLTEKPLQLKELSDLADEKGIHFRSLYLNKFTPWKAFRAIHKIYKGNYDLINSHLPKADLMATLYKKLLNRSTVIVSTKHGYRDRLYMKYILIPEQLPKNSYFYIYRLAESGIDGSYSCSYSLKNFLIKSSAHPSDKALSVIQHGFDFESLEIDRPIDSEAHSSNTLSLIMLGRLHKIKGHRLAIELISMLKDEIDIDLSILGDGDELEDLEILAADLGVSDKVHFLGFQKDIYKYLLKADAMLVTSFVEGLPLMILEGFNAELPVIGWDIPGVNELITHNETGYLAAPYKVNELAEIVKQYHQNRAEAQTISQNAKNLLHTHFSSERMVKETIDFFKVHIPS